jgi:hypothetical protein
MITKRGERGERRLLPDRGRPGLYQLVGSGIPSL